MRTPHLTSKSLLLLSLPGALLINDTSADKPTGPPGATAAPVDQNNNPLAELFRMELQYREKIELLLAVQRKSQDPSITEESVELRRQAIELTKEIGHLNRKIIASRLPARAEEQSWSETVNGLRARLSIERAENSPFLKVFLEIQNTSDVAGIKTIRFTPDWITPTVTNEADKELHRAGGAYDGMWPDWTPLKLPSEGTMRFRINFPRLGDNPKRDKTIVDLGSRHSWTIPEEGEWFLSASLKIGEQQGDHPSMDWSGVLSLPKVPLPQGTKGEQDAAGQPATRPD